VLKSGIGPVVITIIPRPSPKQGAWLNLHRYFGSPSSVISGGGVSGGTPIKEI